MAPKEAVRTTCDLCNGFDICLMPHWKGNRHGAKNRDGQTIANRQIYFIKGSLNV